MAIKEISMAMTETATVVVREDPALKKFRVQLDFNAIDFETLNTLVKDLGLGTRAELFRSAILALQWMVDKKQQGYSVVATEFDGRYIEPEFSFLRNATARKDARATVGAI